MSTRPAEPRLQEIRKLVPEVPMRRAVLPLLLLFVAACSSTPPAGTVPPPPGPPGPGGRTLFSNTPISQGGGTLKYSKAGDSLDGLTITVPAAAYPDRKSTRLNSSHRCISYAVFC